MSDTEKRDYIVVERVTNGEMCGYECGGLNQDEDGDSYCTYFDLDPIYNEQNGAPDGGGDRIYTRCQACLSAPSAVVLTPKMVKAVKTAYETLRLGGHVRSKKRVREAFTPSIFGGDK
jgi:hypothetical protein